MPKKRDNLPYPLMHGLWAKDIAKRVNQPSRNWINDRVRFLLQDISDPSSREQVLAEHTAMLDACCRVYAMMVMAKMEPGSVNRYLSFEAHLQRNLCALGLSKRKRATLSIAETLEQKLKEEEKET